MPGTDAAIQAASERGYEAVILVILVLAGFSALGLIVRQLWSDHRELNVFVRATLVQTLGDNTQAMRKLAGCLRKRPCLKSEAVQLDQIEGEQTQG